jgi:peptidoglycan/LPS O-acetylase OafA/YrhL
MSSSSRPATGRQPRIESVRALAALAVVACHAYAVVNGFIFMTFTQRLILGGGLYGVDVFFCLSAYLLYLPFARRDFAGGPRILLGGYAANRLLRLVPLYYVALVVLAVVNHETLHTVLRVGTFTQNFSEPLVAKAVNGPMWSLVVELHFYVLLPVLAWGLHRLSRGRPGTAAALIVGLGLVSWIVSEAGLEPHDVWTYNLPTTFHFFVPGLLLALARATDTNLPGRADAWLLASVPLWLLITHDYDLAPLAAVASFLVVGAAALPLADGPLVRVLDLRWLAALGTASYSLYVWHLPILEWLPRPTTLGGRGFLTMLAVALPICLVVAAVSYRLVERPFLTRRKRWIDRPAVASEAARD